MNAPNLSRQSVILATGGTVAPLARCLLRGGCESQAAARRTAVNRPRRASARVQGGRSLSFAKRPRRADGMLACLMTEDSTTPDLVESWQQSVAAFALADYDAVFSIYALDAVWVAEALGVRAEGVTAVREFPEDFRGSYEGIRAGIGGGP